MLNRYVNRESFKSSREALAAIVESAADISRIENEIHNFYKYPACFPPKLVSDVISAFSSIGDLVIDPFVGGGTAAVEATLLGRSFIGSDVNDLAVFVSKVKTTPLSRLAISQLDKWISLVSSFPEPDGFDLDEYDDHPELKNIPVDIGFLLGKLKDSFDKIENHDAKRFAQCVVLRSTKARLENGKKNSGFHHLKNRIQENYEDMVDANMGLLQIMNNQRLLSRPKIIKGDITTLAIVEKYEKAKNGKAPKLILTSPPYPGISVLYNRWQIEGRRETMLPYWLIGSNQRASASFYTLHHPKTQLGIETYFDNIKSAFINIRQICDRSTLVAQLVAFGDKKTQFHTYLDAMVEAGFIEIKNLTSTSFDGRIWRQVSNRKWYNAIKDNPIKRNEVLLFFKSK